LNASDWFVLETLHSSLEVFFAATMKTQSNRDTAALYLPTLQFMLDRVDTHRLKFKSLADRYKTSRPEHAILHDAATQSWNKCRKYFDKVDETPTYYAAMILQPHVRLQWLKKHWQNHTEEYVREWYQSTIDKVKAIWHAEYKGQYEHLRAVNYTTQVAPLEREVDDEFDVYNDYFEVDYADYSEIDAFDEYLATAPRPGQDAIIFAQEIEHVKPDMAAFIYDMAAIPAMSAECERIFSSAKLLLSDQRARMTPVLIEAYKCLRHWLLAGTINDPLARILPEYDKDTVTKEKQDEEDDTDERVQDEDDDDDNGDNGFTGQYELVEHSDSENA
jgi:hypothetical protein